LRNNLRKQKRKGAVLVLEEARPYASNTAAAGDNFMTAMLSLFSWSISPQFGCDFRGAWKLLGASRFFGVGWYRKATVWC